MPRVLKDKDPIQRMRDWVEHGVAPTRASLEQTVLELDKTYFRIPNYWTREQLKFVSDAWPKDAIGAPILDDRQASGVFIAFDGTCWAYVDKIPSNCVKNTTCNESESVAERSALLLRSFAKELEIIPDSARSMADVIKDYSYKINELIESNNYK